MTTLVKVRLVIAAMAVVVWGYGYSAEDARVRLAGIVLLAISLLLRWVPRTRGSGDRPA